jgi:hypothetical protein
MGGKGVWGGREYGALGTPRHTDLHFDPQATTFLSPPGGIYLIRRDQKHRGDKTKKYAYAQRGMDFVPIVFTTSGGMGDQF